MMKGLHPELRTYVTRQNPTTTDELQEATKVAEATEVETAPSATSEILDAIRRLEHRAKHRSTTTSTHVPPIVTGTETTLGSATNLPSSPL